MSDEPLADRPDEADTDETLPRGVTALVQAALRSPAPSPGAEAAAQERAQAAYQESVSAPRPLHPEPWRSGPTSLPARIAELLRRLRG